MNIFKMNDQENTVEYFIYKQIDASDKKLSLDYLISEYMASLGNDLLDYIWQNDVFNLKPVVNEKEYYLHGKVNFSDNINDEFFTISLLHKLSIYDPEILVRIQDEDGEVLLIETADYLEKWAQNPEKTEGRVFLYRGNIHIIPFSLDKNFSDRLKLTDFWFKPLKIVQENSSITKCNDNVQKCLKDKLEATKKDYFHISHCFIPFSLAKILQKSPEIIADLVRIIYYRTPDDVKKSRKLPEFYNDNFVLFPVKFTRLLYAQLESQKMEDSFKSEHLKKPFETIPFKAFIRGCKLTLAFRILLSQHSQDKEEESLSSNKILNSFITNLKRNGYFNNEIEGSKIYEEKLKKCKEYFLRMEYSAKYSRRTYLSNDDFKNSFQSFTEEVRDFKKQKLFPEDSDDWMNFSEKEFDDFLTKKFGNNQNFEGDIKNVCENVTKTLGNFIEGNQTETLSDSDESDFNDQNDSDLESESSEFENEISNEQTLNEMKQKMSEMDAELAELLAESDYKGFTLKVPIQTQDSDDDQSDDENSQKMNVCLNLLQSYQGEPEISTGSGPATTIFSSMKSRLSNFEK